MAGVGTLSFVSVVVMLETLNGDGSFNSRFNELTLDKLCEILGESIEDDGDDNKSEIVKCGVLLEASDCGGDKPDWNDNGVDPEVEGRSDDNDDDEPEVEGGG